MMTHHPTTDLNLLQQFLLRERSHPAPGLSAASLFSGGGIGDIGYEQAGFTMVMQVEIDPHRVALCQSNFPASVVLQANLHHEQERIITTLAHTCPQPLDLLSITPPCQGMSSSNPGRGKRANIHERDIRNRLLLDCLPIIHAVMPRMIVAENVIQVLKEEVDGGETTLRKVIDQFRESLPQYELFTGIVQMADYGIPQMRKRAVLVAIHKHEPALTVLNARGMLPWPQKTHSDKDALAKHPWISVKNWLTFMNYPPLDAISTQRAHDPHDRLHFVPAYHGDYYLRVADISPESGQNAYQNAYCHTCGHTDVPEGTATCNSCGANMHNRPYVRDHDGTFRLIKGFDSSYRRMNPSRPAPTITTASSHVGSDTKIHPWENRVLSIRECADLQTIPHYYNWSWVFETRRPHIAREIIGEALPSFFTYIHGTFLAELLQTHTIANVCG